MTKAFRIHETGGPEVLRWEDVDPGAPGEGQILVRHTAVGLNFIDTYHRSGLYPLELPSGIGMEGAGVVEAVGPGVVALKPGDRVAYASGLGSYAEARLMPADRVVPTPDGIEDRQAAAMMLKGMTVETVLFHAAAGGVGLIFCQWAKHLGATVIGTAGSEEKAEIARAHGCDHTILYNEEDFPARVRELTDGKGVPVVYDGVGKSTFTSSLDCLQPRGMMVSFGNASGAVPPFNLGLLSQGGSLYITRPTLMSYTASHEDLLESANALFDVVKSGAVTLEINQTYPLAEAAQAHRDLEARKTTGSTVLLP
jgi:NADPH2:quinone reductase